MIEGLAGLARQRVDAGFQAFLASFMFARLPGDPKAIIGQMRDETQRVYSTFVSRVARRPLSPRSVGSLPIMIAAPDMPVPKRVKLSADEIALNGGLHLHAILLMPPHSRLRMAADEHFRLNQGLYVRDRSRLDRIDVRPIVHTPERAVDYVLKTLRRGRVAYDDILILPRAVAEIRDRATPPPSSWSETWQDRNSTPFPRRHGWTDTRPITTTCWAITAWRPTLTASPTNITSGSWICTNSEFDLLIFQSCVGFLRIEIFGEGPDNDEQGETEDSQ